MTSSVILKNLDKIFKFVNYKPSQSSSFKAEVHVKLNEILRKEKKERIKERKLALKHHQTVHTHARAPLSGRGLFGP